jgi:hypothetical protein
LPIADCRLPIEKAVKSIAPLLIGDRKPAMPAILDRMMLAELLRTARRISQRVSPRGPLAATKAGDACRSLIAHSPVKKPCHELARSSIGNRQSKIGNY